MSILATYESNTRGSAAAQRRAHASVVGGNSRGAAYHRPYPLTLVRAEGATVVDVDGREYLDFINNFTSLVHGHAYPPILEAVSRQVAQGTAWVANNEWQTELAETLIERVASFESVRFTNSGTEAGMLALQIARTITGRTKVLMARYGYHGSLEEFEVGSAPGLYPDRAKDRTLLGTYNDAESFEAVLAEHGDDIAAVVLEPVMGAGGVISATPEFLTRVRDAAHAAGALLVFDEVIAFRLATGGTQSLVGIEPDLTMLGKLIGGGFPVGGVGGKREYLEIFDPENPRGMHSGTYNGNPVTMTAGLVSVRELTAERIRIMEELGERLAASLARSAGQHGLPLGLNRCGSLLQVYFSDEAEGEGPDRMSALHLAALNHGLMFASRGMICLSTVMDETLIDEAAQRADAAMEDVARELG
ncbi:MAG: aminotransferase class III-fold pyridoxal phosphate-dependent enzyme [Gammaproteobacteria bacterium]|nr:aminotransferase class III-fold pyridoxal phosphate-dependent enzyme [Gammaproteobacteria bacterium]MYB39624.1 aminotransferase class III-fold pyridoxal phosphate-dependent enzyme [Gammaproteobacteria bacterium]